MDQIDFRYQNELDRVLTEYTDEELKPRGQYDVSAKDVIKAHFLLCDYFSHQDESMNLSGVRDKNLLLSAIGRQNVSYGNKIKWVELYDISATLLFGLIKDHPFHDGNKRTALLVLFFQLLKHKRKPIAKQINYEQLAIKIADNKLSEYNFSQNIDQDHDFEVNVISKFLRKNFDKLDQTYKTLTYEEFNNRLVIFNVKLDNPYHNHIDVYKKIGLLKQWRKVDQIGFPGWKKQIDKVAFSQVLKSAEIDREHGYDNEIFLSGGDPFYKLIEQYESLYRRLKDK